MQSPPEGVIRSCRKMIQQSVAKRKIAHFALSGCLARRGLKRAECSPRPQTPRKSKRKSLQKGVCDSFCCTELRINYSKWVQKTSASDFYNYFKKISCIKFALLYHLWLGLANWFVQRIVKCSSSGSGKLCSPKICLGSWILG